MPKPSIFKTGNPDFDSIFNIWTGSLISVFDENGLGLTFLDALLADVDYIPAYLLSSRSVKTRFQQVEVGLESINELNLTLAELRSRIRKGVLIHAYLPELVLKARNNAEAILNLLEHWAAKIANKKFVEFVITPRGVAPPDLERGLSVISEASLALTVRRVGSVVQPCFIPLHGAKTRYQFLELPYSVKRGRITVRWDCVLNEKPQACALTTLEGGLRLKGTY